MGPQCAWRELEGGGQEGLRMGKYGARGGVRGDGAPS